MIYDNLVKNTNNITKIKNKVIINFVKGATVEIKGPINEQYTVKFINSKTGVVHFKSNISNNMWTKCSIEYFVPWKIQITDSAGNLFHEYNYNASGKRVYIAFDSRALGDTLSWIPYVDEFRKQHNCTVVCSTFMNDLFVNEYKDIEFVEPGTSVSGLYGMYSLGLFYNNDNTVNHLKNPTDPKSQTMQKMATDILGLDYIEIKPKIKNNKLTPSKTEKQVCIAIHGTAQSKYWNNPTGWQEVVDWLKVKGYNVKLISRENDGYMGNSHPTGIIKHPTGPLTDIIDELQKSYAFIGIGSGLSWLSWGLNVPTVLISGFSYDWAEMKDCYRISAPNGSCSGCFNRIRLDAGDWNWCPDHKGTERQFECTKSISGSSVIKELEKFL
jgi:autotransporter strand-loop-strand O-heptosyltransferase